MYAIRSYYVQSGIDDDEVDARLLPDAPDELLAVGGLASYNFV